jgi:hypothetical protein
MNPKSYVVLLKLDAPINTPRCRHINRERHTDFNPWMTRLQINLIARYILYAFVLSVFILCILFSWRKTKSTANCQKILS